MNKFQIKTPAEIEIMAEGGRILGRVKKALFEKVRIGTSAIEIEILANKLIKEAKAEASFKKVPGYSWATCININEGLVHGIPRKDMVFKKGDIVSVDLGVYFQGFHTDSSFTKGLEVTAETERFLQAGKTALNEAINATRAGNYIYDISEAIDRRIRKEGFCPVTALVGHGVGRALHEDPPIPCFLPGKKSDSPLIPEGGVFAIEVMYTLGSPDLVLASDGWTIATRDDKIAALYEETVAVLDGRPRVLTDFL